MNQKFKILRKGKRREFGKRLFAGILVLLMVVGIIPVDMMFNMTAKASTVTYDMDLSNLVTDHSSPKGENWQAVTKDGYFTIMGYGKIDNGNFKGSIIETNSQTIEGKNCSYRFNTQGTAKTKQASVKFTTSKAAKVTVYWCAGGNGRNIKLFKGDSDDDIIGKTSQESIKNSFYKDEFEITEAGTYYIGSINSGNYIYGITVVEGIESNSQKVSADITYNNDTVVSLSGAYDVETATLGEIKASDERIVFGEQPDAKKLSIAANSTNKYDGTSSFTVSIDTEGKKVVVKNGETELIAVPYVVDGYLNTPKIGDSESYDFQSTGKVFESDSVNIANKTSPNGYILISKNENSILSDNGGKGHGLYAGKSITFTVKVPANAQGTFTIGGCKYSEKTNIKYYVVGEESNAKSEELYDGTKSGDIIKSVNYKNMTASEVTLKIELEQTGEIYIHNIKYAIDGIPNTVKGNIGKAVAGKTLEFKSGNVAKTTTINEDGSYSIELKNGLKYEVSLTDSTEYSIDEDSDIVDLTNVKVGEDVIKDITIEAIPVLVTHPDKVSKVPFKTNFGSGNLTVNELGQTLVLNQNEGKVVPNKIEKSDLSFYAFDKTSEAVSLEADIVLKEKAGSNNNYFVSFGVIKELNTDTNKYAALTSGIRNNNDVVMLYSKKEDNVLGKSGNTAVTAAKEERLHFSIKKADAGFTLSVTNTSGNSNPKTMKYSDIIYGNWSKDDEVQYGLILAGVQATITNMIYKDADGKVLYDQNVYYDPMGTAPSITAVNAKAAADRTKIDITWTGDKAKYDGKYVLEVLKPGETEWKVISDELTDNSYAYNVSAGEGGNYRFRVSGTLGVSEEAKKNNVTTPVESNAEYIEPALETPELSVEYVSPADKVTLNWNAVDKATAYEIYRRSSDESQSTLIATIEETSYVDKSVVAETPYYYYIKATSADNWSVNKDEEWTLPTSGHSGNYDEDVALYVVNRSYNTVFSDSITIEGVAGAPGTVTAYVNDVEQQTVKIEAANDRFVFDNNIKLTAGRNEVKLVLDYGNGLKLEKNLNYVLLSNYDYVVDMNYDKKSGTVSEEYGVPTYTKVQDAIDAVGSTNDSTKIIFVRNGEYNEQISVKNPNISLIGEDSQKTHIFFAVNEGNKTTVSETKSRYAFTVSKEASNFTAENLCIENSWKYLGDGTISNESAEAFYTEANGTMLVGVRFISNQDTIQFKNNDKVYFLRCYVLGNVDFIWGQNTKAVFEDSDIVFRYAQKKNSGYITAFNTSTIVFNNCRFTSETSCGGSKYYLGRPYNNKDVEIAFVNCYMGGAINSEIGSTDWSQKEISTNEEVYKVAKYLECGTYGQKYAVNINRRQISKVGAEKLLAEAGKENSEKEAEALSSKYIGEKSIESDNGMVETPYEADKYSPYETNDKNLAKYNVEGFASTTNVTGGGLLKENNSNYYKVKTANEFLDALNTIKNSKGVPSVIELEDDINLGYNEIDNPENYPSSVLAKHNSALINPVLVKTGVSKVYIQDMSNLTIFSSKGYSIKHAALDIKQSSNIIIRNIKFDELWEWDEQTKGDYDVNDWDYLTIENASTGIWVDHCTFFKSYDGVIDMKTDAAHNTSMNITVSWCEFLPGSEDNIFFNEMMDYLDKNADNCPYYKSLLDSGMTKSQIWWYAYGQKKTHLLGQDDSASANVNLNVTFANNYYYNSMDRMPRLRYGTAHIYNCILSAQELANARASIKNEDAAKHIVSNGASSTCGGHLLMENSVISGIANALNSGNGNSPAGYINAKDTDYFYNGIRTKLEVTNNNTQKDGALIQDADEFISALPYSYVKYDSSSLEELMVPFAGAGKIKLETAQWEKSTYYDNNEIVTANFVESEVGVGAPKAKLDGTFEEIKNLVFTEAEIKLIENGAKAKVKLSINKKDIEEAEAKLLTDKLTKINTESKYAYKVGMVLDIALSKSINGVDTDINETNGKVPLKITINLSDELLNNNSKVERTYKILRIHNGKIDVLDCLYNDANKTIQFESNQFSTYVIIYQDKNIDETISGDVEDKPEDNNNPSGGDTSKDNSSSSEENTTQGENTTSGESPETRDSARPWMYVIMMAIATGLIISSKKVIVISKKTSK